MQYVEYIQTDGYSWFDTGIIPNINTRVEIDRITPIQEGGDYCCEGYIGAQNTDDSSDTFQIRQQGNYSENKMWLRVGGTQISPSMTALTWTNVSLDKNNFTANGETFNIGTTTYGTCNYTLYISAIHNPQWDSSTSRYRASASQIGRVKVYESGVLVGDFVPAIDDNNNVGYYDEVSQTFKTNLGTGTPVAGPALSSISASASKSVLAATGETINIVVNCENAWEVTGDTFLVLSSTGDTGSTTITATAPSYSGVTARTDTLTFTDSVTGDEAEITIKQKKYTDGEPMYLGADEITEIYLGVDEITEAYLGDVLVFSTGPFQGLRIIPSTISFTSGSLTRELKIKSSEAWSMTLPSWISASDTTGDTGETIITITATTQTATTTDSITVTSANYTASASVSFVLYEELEYIYESNSTRYQREHHLDTGIAHTASTMSIEIEYYGLGGNSDRMVGYQQGDTGCASDDVDFRLFGYSNGTFDYMSYRQSFGGTNQGYQHLTIGDCYCYNNQTSQYLCQGSVIVSVPSPDCHILVDVSLIKVKSVKISDGNNVLFDGVAAELGGVYGLFDRVGGQLITNSNITLTGDPITT